MLLAHKPESTKEHKSSKRAKNDSKSNHSTDDAADSRRNTGVAALLLGARTAAVADVRSASAGRVTALGTPLLAVGDCKLGEIGLEVVPGDGVRGATKQRVSDRLGGVGGGAVVEEEADREIVGGREARGDIGVGEELEYEGRCVIDDTGEVFACLGQVDQTEERQSGCVGAELDTKLICALGRDGAVHVREDFTGELHASNGTHVVRSIVCETVLVSVGQCKELVKGLVGENI